jgi:hypothetical protein
MHRARKLKDVHCKLYLFSNVLYFEVDIEDISLI